MWQAEVKWSEELQVFEHTQAVSSGEARVSMELSGGAGANQPAHTIFEWT